MSAMKTIAIIGATEESGRIIAEKFSFMPYRLLLISNNLEQLKMLTENILAKKNAAEIDSIECVKEGCWEADIIILAVPSCEEKEVAEKMKEVSTQKIVVAVYQGFDSLKDLHKILPYSKLVKVSGVLEHEILISGEDDAVNEEIRSIFDQAGFCVKAVVDLQASNK